MSAEIINLRQARKHKARAEADAMAAQNRITFGLSKAQRQAAKLARDDAARGLEGHKLPPPKPDDG